MQTVLPWRAVRKAFVWRRWLYGSMLWLTVCSVQAAPQSVGSASLPSTVDGWVARMHDAARHRSYSGTWVVGVAGGSMASSRVWHVCDGQTQMERVDALTGTPRTVFRRNGAVRIFFPETHIVRDERRDALGSFPPFPAVEGAALAQHYTAESQGEARVAGLVADVVWFRPRDALRFGYRLWVDHDTGLLLQIQTLAASQQVLEQAAFSEVELREPVSLERLQQMMRDTQGYRAVVGPEMHAVPRTQGWLLRQPIAGFVAVQCYAHAHPASTSGRTEQCVYSDGLATVSLFVELYGAARPASAMQSVAVGATHSLTARAMGNAWVTAVGEVPPQTLKLFTEQLVRAP